MHGMTPPAWPWPTNHPDMHRNLALLLRALRGVPVTGWEVSCKFQPGTAWSGRLLAGFSPRGVSRRYLEQFPASLEMPAAVAAIFAGQWARCQQIFLALESRPSGTVMKVYLEYPKPVPAGTPRPCLAIRGFKWPTGQTLPPWHETEYWCLNGLTVSQAVTWLQQPDAKDAERRLLDNWLADTLLQTRRRAGEWRDFQLLLSREPTSPREALNLRFYESGLRVRHLGGGLRHLGQHWGIPSPDIERFLADAGEREIGWLHAGRGSTAQAFLTVYCAATRADAQTALLLADAQP